VRLKFARVKGNPALARQTQGKLAQVRASGRSRPNLAAEPLEPLRHGGFILHCLLGNPVADLIALNDGKPWSGTSRTSGAPRIRRPWQESEGDERMILRGMKVLGGRVFLMVGRINL